MVIGKYLSGNTPAIINLANFAHNGVAQVWQLTAANAINRLADVGISGNNFGVTLPPQSITLFVVAGNLNVPSAPAAPSNVTVTPQ